jgi:hypothetical protein
LIKYFKVTKQSTIFLTSLRNFLKVTKAKQKNMAVETRWKKFRYCPSVSSLPREKWTSNGYYHNKCVAVIGQIKFPPKTEIKWAYDVVGSANQALLVPGSLKQIDGNKLENLLTDEHGTLSSLANKETEYSQTELMKPDPSSPHGLVFFRTYRDALQHHNTVNLEDEPDY